MEDVRKEMKESAVKYGIDGDKSLEYYGLVIKNGKIDGTKLYRRPSNQCDESEFRSRYMNNFFFSEVIRYVKIYDFSIRKDASQNEFIRMVFSPFISILKDEEKFNELLNHCKISNYSYYFKKLTEYYIENKFSGTSPLLKMGIEIDSEENVREAKAYFALRSFDNMHDSHGNRYRYRDCKSYVEKSLELLKMSDLCDDFATVSERMEEMEYFPVFTGINFAKNYVEMKVYYETVFSDYSEENILSKENEVMEFMANEEDAKQMKDIHADIIRDDMFLDCVSYSVKRYSDEKVDEILWKPYYLELNEKLVQIRYFEKQTLDSEIIISTDTEQYKSVLLVDEKDNPCGFMEKIKAHTTGSKHRAFSIFLHDGKGNMLVQRRAMCKYHSPGLITNACCSHPLTSYIVEEAKVRLREELGLTGIELREVMVFDYQAKVGKDLIENEIDHVLIGTYSGEVDVCEEESDAAWYMPFDEILTLLKKEPEKFTAWFILLAKQVIEIIKCERVPSEEEKLTFSQIVKRGHYIYFLRKKRNDDRLDRLIAGRSLRGLILNSDSEKYFPTQSVDYRVLDSLLKHIQVDRDDVFVDVGSGFGRLIGYFNLKGKKPKKYIGIEINKDAAEFSKDIFKDKDNIEIINADATKVVVSDATKYILFNPFGKEILQEFLNNIEKNNKKGVVIYYLQSIYYTEFENRKDRWELVKNTILEPENYVPVPLRKYVFKGID